MRQHEIARPRGADRGCDEGIDPVLAQQLTAEALEPWTQKYPPTPVRRIRL